MGPGAGQKYIEKISPAIPKLAYLQQIIEKELDGFKRGKKHTSPSKERDVAMLTSTYLMGRVHETIPGRRVPVEADYKPDFVTKGSHELFEKGAFDQWWQSRSFPRSTEERYTMEMMEID